MPSTIILQVQYSEADREFEHDLVRRFGRFIDTHRGRVEYPCTNDSHAFDVYRDEFDAGSMICVDYAAVIELPYDADSFVPFTEESAGITLAELDDETGELKPVA